MDTVTPHVRLLSLCRGSCCSFLFPVFLTCIHLISSGNCWNAMEEDFLSTRLLVELLPRASLIAFMLAWEMSVDTAVKRSTWEKGEKGRAY